MLAVVKKPHTKNPLFEVKGEIPSELLKYLHKTFGDDVEVIAEEDQITDIFTSSWFQNISDSTLCLNIERTSFENQFIIRRLQKIPG